MKIVDNAKSIVSDSYDYLENEQADWEEESKREQHQLYSDIRHLSRAQISTASAYEIQNAEVRSEYESNAIKYNEDKHIKSSYNNKIKQRNIKAETDSKMHLKANSNSAQTGMKQAAKNAGNTAANKAGSATVPWLSAVNLGKSITPEILKAKNYTAKKNSQRIKYLSDGVDDIENETTNKTLGIFARVVNKAREIHFNASILAWQINWIAGLVVTLLPLSIALFSLILFVVRLGIDVLPPWAYSEQYTVRQLMAQYEYYWDCANLEISASVENGKDGVIAIPIALDEEEEWSVEYTNGKNFINWREVLAVYYAYQYNVEELPDTELTRVSSSSYVVNTLFAETNESKFNEVFWTMNCIMPSGNHIVCDVDKVSDITNKKINSVAYNICYHPSLKDVEIRLGLNWIQKSLVEMYLSPEYDFYFDNLIQNRYISSNQHLVDIAAAELGNHGAKYNEHFGFNRNTQWCCVFVAWCLEQSGNSDYITHHSGCTQALHGGDGTSGWKNRSDIAIVHYVSGSKPESIKPQPGWIVLFNTDGNPNNCEHIGIVESYDASNNMVITIEGNTRHEALRPADGNYVARMHRTNWSTIYCFVELKFPGVQGVATERYKSSFNAQIKYGEDDYADICKAATKAIKLGEPLSLTLGVVENLVSLNGVAEWSVMCGITYVPGVTPAVSTEPPIVNIRQSFVPGSGVKMNQDIFHTKYLINNPLGPKYNNLYCKYYSRFMN